MRSVRGFTPELVRRRGSGDSGTLDEIDGSSPAIQALKRDIVAVARDPHVTVLITGESGTGKERVARAIHGASPRAAGPFVVVDCAALSASLAEDTLFGHVRGAFTGAVDDRPGPFERGHGGTVLLDEIGDLPLELQMKLLRTLQARTVQRLGARQESPFDVRVVAATNVDLARAIARRRFREDLYHRLAVFTIHVPALRQRGGGDIQLLTDAVLGRQAARRGARVPAIAPEIRDLFARHPWPGNVRELENAVERMLVAAGGEPLITARHLGGRLQHAVAAEERAAPLPSHADVMEALRRNGFRRGRTAAALGVSRHQLYRLVKQRGALPDAGQR